MCLLTNDARANRRAHCAGMADAHRRGAQVKRRMSSWARDQDPATVPLMRSAIVRGLRNSLGEVAEGLP